MKKVIIQGISWDKKSSYKKGPRLAPARIRKALTGGSMNLFTEKGTSIESLIITDKGDFNIEEYFDIEEVTKQHLNAADKVFTLGGDHSVTFPIIKAFYNKYPKLDILQFDAHPDLYSDYNGDPYSHACPFARIMENGLAARLVQVGIRTLNPHQAGQAEKYKVEIYEMKHLDTAIMPKFKNPLYISLDMDVFDPAYAPGVSHHEPGGMSSRQVIKWIQQIETPVVGADIVEYNPKRDSKKTTAFLAAKLMKEILGKMMEK